MQSKEASCAKALRELQQIQGGMKGGGHWMDNFDTTDKKNNTLQNLTTHAQSTLMKGPGKQVQSKVDALKGAVALVKQVGDAFSDSPPPTNAELLANCTASIRAAMTTKYEAWLTKGF
eukprot:1926494-Pyramimonas_sp.AAC.1